MDPVFHHLVDNVRAFFEGWIWLSIPAFLLLLGNASQGDVTDPLAQADFRTRLTLPGKRNSSPFSSHVESSPRT